MNSALNQERDIQIFAITTHWMPIPAGIEKYDMVSFYHDIRHESQHSLDTIPC